MIQTKKLNVLGNRKAIFDKLFDEAVDDYIIFRGVYAHIMFKGVGDLFQEINNACKFGGYINDVSRINDSGEPIGTNNEPFDQNGNALRFFVANDRPSGLRFAMFITYANEEDINRKAFGGYYPGIKVDGKYVVNTKQTFVVKRRTDKDVCSEQSVSALKSRKPTIFDPMIQRALSRRTPSQSIFTPTLPATKRVRTKGGQKKTGSARKTKKLKYKQRI